MKLPISWLKDYVDLREKPADLAEALLLSGTKVESIEEVSGEVVFDFEITPNRPDCLSAIGIAREIAALYDRKLRLPEVENQHPHDGKLLKINLKEKDLCPYFTYGVIENVKIGKSPDWLAKRLELSGIRTINNIVDITNYVMLETGQPMHAFDLEKISGDLLIRKSKKDEVLTTLDAVERKLPANAIVIEDDRGLIDLAGIMGGKNSQISENTNKILLLVPIYDRVLIRKASQQLNFRSEASNIFEKRLDPNGHRFAFERASQLLTTLAQGQLQGIESFGYPVEAKEIEFSLSQLGKEIGVSLPSDQVEEILNRLSFATSLEHKDTDSFLRVEVPTFRTDIKESFDLVEEVGRIYGYNRLPKALPTGPLPALAQKEAFQSKVVENLSTLGLHEIYSSSLSGGEGIEKTGFSANDTLRVTNRLVVDYDYLRPSLLVGLLAAAALNQTNFDRFALFEVGRVFHKQLQNNKDLEKNQPKKVAAIFSGFSYAESKGVMETFLKKIGVGKVSFTETSSAPFGSCLEVSSSQMRLGLFGEISSAVLGKLEIDRKTFAFELDFQNLEEARKPLKHHPLAKYPDVKEDLSLFVPSQISFAEIDSTIEKHGSEFLEKIVLLEDIFIKGQRSLLIGLQFRSSDRTLSSQEIRPLVEAISASLKKLGVEVRE